MSDSARLPGTPEIDREWPIEISPSRNAADNAKHSHRRGEQMVTHPSALSSKTG
jgi:hypothetical protein